MNSRHTHSILITTFYYLFFVPKVTRNLGTRFGSKARPSEFWTGNFYMVSAPHYNGGGGDLIWKFAKILWGQNFFLHLWGINLYGMELKLYGVVIFVMNFLWMHQELLLADILKSTKKVLQKNFTFCAY